MIAVIGATGFTGRRVVHELRCKYPDGELVAVGRQNSRRQELLNQGVPYRVGDLNDLTSLRSALEGARLVVSTVSLGFGHAPNLVAALQANRVDHVIFFSTMSIYSQVASRSRGARLEAEDLIIGSGLPYTIFRPTMIYGRPGDRNVERLLRFLKRSPIMPLVGNGGALQQPVHVDDLASIVAKALGSSNSVGHTYNLPGPRPLRFTEMVKCAANVLNRRPVQVHIPMGLARSAVGVWSITGLWPRLRPEQISRLTENKQADPSRATRDLGFSPREFEDGVQAEASLLGLIDKVAARDRSIPVGSETGQ